MSKHLFLLKIKMLVSILTIHFQLEVHFFIKAIIRFGILYDVVSCILSADFAACLLHCRLKCLGGVVHFRKI